MRHVDASDVPMAAAERTALAWTRSSLALVAIGALVIRASSRAGLEVVGLPVAAALMIAAGLMWARGRARGPQYWRVPATRTLRAVAAGTVVIALLALFFAIAAVVTDSG